MGGKVYTDGSCTKFGYQAANRAGWGICEASADGDITATWCGLTPSSRPQTSPSGEHEAMSKLAAVVSSDTLAHIDYQGVIRAWQQPRKAAGPGRPYAGIYRVACGRPRASQLDVKWVKAHQAEQAAGTEEKKHAEGNNMADILAKAGAHMHPRMSTAEAAQVEATLADHRAYLIHAATVLAEWAAERDIETWRGQLHAKQRAAKPNKQAPQHCWRILRASWRCMTCLVGAANLQSRARAKPCRGAAPFWEELVQNARGHQLVLFSAGTVAVVGCSTCGANAEVKARFLLTPCPGHFPNENQRKWWKRMSSGFHPKTGAWIGEGRPLAAILRWATNEAEDDKEMLLSDSVASACT